MASKHTGGCACKAIRYEINADPAMTGMCQCQDCQRATGTGHATAMMFPEAAMKMTGTPKFHAVKADLGSTVSRGFCANCGSPVMSRTTGMPGVAIIYVGSLDDPSVFQPQMSVYSKRGHAWDKLDPAMPKFPAMPPMPGQ